MTQQILRRFQESFDKGSGSYDGIQFQGQARTSEAGASEAAASGAVRISALRGTKPERA